MLVVFNNLCICVKFLTATIKIWDESLEYREKARYVGTLKSEVLHFLNIFNFRNIHKGNGNTWGENDQYGIDLIYNCYIGEECVNWNLRNFTDYDF